MELQAIHQGLQLALEHNLNICEVETDAIKVIKLLEHPPSFFANIVNEYTEETRKSPDST